MLVASLGTTRMLTAVFAFLFATFLVLTLAVLAAPPNATLIKVGGWLGLITAVLAWYCSFAGVSNATWGRTVLPVFPWKKN
jgi:succinate-acetate transporter protein